ncbi:hypothetical protein N7532_000606 [Penicillium argentinense]|uniref:Uncharacterized protein n=1 Tax=Penicillium argentinense TaxID=1131581 RepID=A0A9W9KP04_9EURO|nr:uncharacterized protein N7532_000606 [Penicillium argentinense]KAJ5112561.1 hypothetical protein N7532_000606 [Penicillium argentinense]
MHGKDEYRLSYVPLEDERGDTGINTQQQSRQRPLSSAEQALLQSQIRGFWGSSWAFEILGCLTSIAFLIAIIVVLFKYDGRPMPDWPYGITLNALVSVLSTVMKATMAFVLTECLAQLKWSWFHSGNKLSDLAILDAASPEVLLAPQLFYFTLCLACDSHLVTFGCLVLVIAAATDPFVQQVMAVKERSIRAPGQASIQVCNSSLYTDYGEGAGPGMNKVPLGTSGAIYSGIFQTQSENSKSVMMNCPTGNCTYPPYQSLGFCSKCANITDLLTESSPSPATECALYFCIDTYQASVREGHFTETRTAVSTASNSSNSWKAAGKNIALTPDFCYSNGTRHTKPYNENQNCIYDVNWLSRISMANSLQPLLKGSASRFVSNRPDFSSDTIEVLYGTYGNFNDINSVFQ